MEQKLFYVPASEFVNLQKLMFPLRQSEKIGLWRLHPYDILLCAHYIIIFP